MNRDVKIERIERDVEFERDIEFERIIRDKARKVFFEGLATIIANSISETIIPKIKPIERKKELFYYNKNKRKTYKNISVRSNRNNMANVRRDTPLH